MEERERRVLERHREDLVSAIADVEPVLDRLVSTGVFRANDDNVQVIRSERTPLMRARKLLDILPSRGGAAFSHFVDALRSKRSHVDIAEMLERSLTEIADASSDATDFHRLTPQYDTPVSKPSHPTACKLQDALRSYHRQKAKRMPLFDFQSGGESVGLDEVFVTLSTLDFRELQLMFAERKHLSAETIRELASKTWSERRQDAQEVTELNRLLRLSNGEPSEGTLLLAQAAGGKTLTLLKIASLWAEGETDFLQQFEFVFFVSGRDEKALKGTSAVDVLQLEEFDLDSGEQAEMVKYFSENSEKVLVLLDGADEGGEMWMKSKGLEKIFQRKGALRNCSFVVSSRPCEAAYRLIRVCDQHFHLVGLNDHHLEELLVRRLGEVGGHLLAAELKQPKWSQLRALMKETPLVANMVAALQKDGLALPSTRTELYTVVVVNMVRRAISKSHEARSSLAKPLEHLPTEDKVALFNVGQVALNGLKRQRYVFDLHKEVGPVCGDAAERFGFVEEFRTMSVRGERHEVQFCHLSYQEYLAAYLVSQSANVKREIENCCQAIGFGDETAPFWRFVGGLLGLEKVKVLMSFLGGPEAAGESWRSGKHLLFQMSCFAEAMEQPCSADATAAKELSRRRVQEAARTFLPEAVDLSSQMLSLNDIHAIAVSLAHSRHVHSLSLSSSSLNIERVRALCAHGGVQNLRRLHVDSNPGLHGEGLTVLAHALGENGQLVLFGGYRCGLNIDDCAALKHILTTNKKLHILNLPGNTGFSTKAWKYLKQPLADGQLSCLCLSNTSMDAEGAGVVSEVLADNRHLQQVYLDYNPLGNRGAALVLESAKKTKSLTKLSMDGTHLDDGVVPLLLATMQARASTLPSDCGQSRVPLTVSLHGNQISTHALAHLASKMPRHSAVQVLCNMHTIRNGQVHQQDLSVYFDMYKQQGGKGDLQMNYTGIDEVGVAQITRQLEKNRCSVEALVLARNSIDDNCAVLLADSLSSNSTLRGLSLIDNKVKGRGFAALTKTVVQSNTSLQALDLCGNPIFGGSKDCSAAQYQEQLGALLACSASFKFLGLGESGLGDDECSVIAAALAKNTGSIAFIDLGGNQISDKGAVALASGLEQNITVHFLDLSHNQIDKSGAAAISRCVQVRERKKSRLRRVWMAGNQVDASQLVGCMVDGAFMYWNLSSVISTYL